MNILDEIWKEIQNCAACQIAKTYVDGTPMQLRNMKYK